METQTPRSPSQHKNRLAQETSPYLHQHQDNPVDWYPWGEEALQRAKSEDKPILLSIGYSACHWCHVMAHECFENPEIAQQMNDSFINIKVDREERPDLDQVYQNVAQAMTRGGGWPLTVFLTPDLEPFYGGTYFPPEDRYGRPGFPRVLRSLSNAYQNDPGSVEENALKLTEYITASEEIVAPAAESVAESISIENLKLVAARLLSRVDFTHGGLVGAPKFPNPMVFVFLWRFGIATSSAPVMEGVKVTLDRMACGGIYDQLGGGFHRYSVDETWSVPHFEKMLYDNALLLKLYSEVLMTEDSQFPSGFVLTPRDRGLYRRIVAETVQYVEREMTSADGMFYAAQDADTEGEEGKYFVWNLNELRQLLTTAEVGVFARTYGVTEGGNFEHGSTVLYLNQQVVLNPAEQDLLKSARTKIFAARNQRVRPGLDHKVLTSWNGLMISGLAWAGQALRTGNSTSPDRNETTVAESATRAAEKAYKALVSHVSRDSHRLFSTYQGGVGKFNGYLDDYAFLAMAALDLARFTVGVQSPVYQLQSSEWVDVILKYFADSKGPGYFFTSSDHEKLIQRPKSISDQAIPSGVAVALTCMLTLGGRHRAEVEKQIQALFPIVQQSPFGFGEFLCLCLLDVGGPALGQGLECRGPACEVE